MASADLYTFGQNVSTDLTFAAQLFKGLSGMLNPKISGQRNYCYYRLHYTRLINAFEPQNPAGNNELVTLLTGINNKYHGLLFSVYKTALIALFKKSVTLAKK
ncbi:MAG: hypothetical protein H7296_03275 [Bacteroidia bacterium]|nr:hypothetical protein [Bacteroidia bacterium]